MKVNPKDVARAIKALDKADDALQHLAIFGDDDRGITLLSSIREYAEYLQRIHENKNSWLYKEAA